MALLSEYGFNEGSGSTAADSSGNGRDLTGGTFDQAGHTLSAGSGWSGAVGPGTPSAFTLMAWVRLAASGSWEWIATNNGNLYFEIQPDGTPQAYIGAGGYPVASSPLQVGVWTHVTVTCTGSSGSSTAGKVYLNGVLSGSGFAGSPGSLTSVDVASSNVTVDDFRSFDTALSQSTIQTWMNTPVGGAAEDHTGTGAALTFGLTLGQGVGVATEAASGTGTPLSVPLTLAAGQGVAALAGDGAALAVPVGLSPGTGTAREAASGTGLPLTIAVTLGPGVGSAGEAATGTGQPLTLSVALGAGIGNTTEHASGTGHPLAVSVALAPGVGHPDRPARDISITVGATYTDWLAGPAATDWTVSAVAANPTTAGAVAASHWTAAPVEPSPFTAGPVTGDDDWTVGPVTASYSAGPVYTQE